LQEFERLRTDPAQSHWKNSSRSLRGTGGTPMILFARLRQARRRAQGIIVVPPVSRVSPAGWHVSPALYLKNRDVNHPRFSISILAPSMKFSGPCSIRTTQQKVAIAKNVSQSTKRKYRTRRYYPSAVSIARGSRSRPGRLALKTTSFAPPTPKVREQ
jgi:hypothetical protein